MLLIGHENLFYLQVRKADFKNDPYAIDFGISISDNMVELSGRVLEAPKLQYGGRVGIVEFPKFRIRIRFVLTSQDTFMNASFYIPNRNANASADNNCKNPLFPQPFEVTSV